MEKFTVSEVRDHAEWLSGVAVIGTGKTCHMLNAFADLLEAREKAVPVAWMEIPPGEQADPYYPGYSFHGLTSLPSGRHDLFLRPMTSPADAERLAEALRELSFAAQTSGGVAGHDAGLVAAIDNAAKALAAHPSQAQPPAASVTDAMVNAAMRADFCGHNVADALMCGTDWTTEVMRAALEAALAAQENPNG